MGGRNLLILVWGGLLFQIVSPFVILFYMLYLLWALPLPVFVAVNLVITLFYLAIAFVLYLVYLTCISRQPRRDLPDLLLLPAFFALPDGQPTVERGGPGQRDLAQGS